MGLPGLARIEQSIVAGCRSLAGGDGLRARGGDLRRGGGRGRKRERGWRVLLDRRATVRQD